MKTSIQSKLEQTLNRRLQELPNYVDDFIYSIKNSKKIRTRLEYTKDIYLFFEFLAQTQRITVPAKEVPLEQIKQLTTRDIEEFFDFLTLYQKTHRTSSGKEITQTYQNQTGGKSRKLASLREWFLFLEKRNLINQNPLTHLEFETKKHVLMKDTLQPGELQKLLAFIQAKEVINKKQYALDLRKRDYMIVLLLGYTGIRVSELIQLDREDIHLSKQLMIVYRKGGKPQRIPLSPRLIEELEHYLTYRNELIATHLPDKNALFLNREGQRLTDQSVRKLLDKYGKAINASTKLTPHTLRRTFGTEHYNRFGDMDLTATVLGHASTETTRKHYARVDENRIRESLMNFDYDQN